MLENSWLLRFENLCWNTSEILRTFSMSCQWLFYFSGMYPCSIFSFSASVVIGNGLSADLRTSSMVQIFLDLIVIQLVMKSTVTKTWMSNPMFTRAYSLSHSWSWTLLEKPPTLQPLKNFPAFYGTRRFMTTHTIPSYFSKITRAYCWTMS
jgi:hypothetical protein